VNPASGDSRYRDGSGSDPYFTGPLKAGSDANKASMAIKSSGRGDNWREERRDHGFHAEIGSCPVDSTVLFQVLVEKFIGNFAGARRE
jgi:hypothetical protein